MTAVATYPYAAANNRIVLLLHTSFHVCSVCLDTRHIFQQGSARLRGSWNKILLAIRTEFCAGQLLSELIKTAYDTEDRHNSIGVTGPNGGESVTDTASRQGITAYNDL